MDRSTLNGGANLQMTYDAMGNITNRNDVAGGATWTYHATKKHAVTQAGSSSYTYSYDANGNAITRNGYGISWSSYNYPSQIAAGSETATFSYDHNRQRYKQTYTNGSGTETTWYVGGMLEKTVLPSGTIDWRHYVYAGSRAIAVISRLSSGANSVHYVLEDHLGSTSEVVGPSGTVEVRESYGAFGAGRNPATWSGSVPPADQTTINSISRRGYTFHTALGTMGLIHMNGRVQDSTLGRFLSPDPNVPHAMLTQSYNRFSYVRNNPLTFTDPSGFVDTLDTVTVFGSLPGFSGPGVGSASGVPSDPNGYLLNMFAGARMAPEPLSPVVVTARKLRQRASKIDFSFQNFDLSAFSQLPPLEWEDLFPSRTQKPDTCKSAANAPKGLAATNKAFRNNSDPNKRFTVDASQLTVKQTTNFNSNGRAVGVVQGGDWFVHGTVTLQNSGGSISIKPEQYNFEQHNVTSVGEFFRNIETYGGYYVATFGGLSDYWADLTGGNTATDFWFDFTCSPTVVR